MLKVIKIFLIFLICLFVFPSYSYSAYDSTSKIITIGYIRNDLLHAPALLLMKTRKALEAKGYNVIWKCHTTGSGAIQQLAFENVDFAVTGISPVVIINSLGAKIKVLAGANMNGSSLIFDPERKKKALVKGRPLNIGLPGLGSVQDTVFKYKYRKPDFNFVYGGVKHLITQFENGELDGLFVWEPYPTILLEKYPNLEVIESKDLVIPHQCCVFVTNSKMEKFHKDVVDDVLAVYKELMNEVPSSLNEIEGLAATTFNTTKEVIRKAQSKLVYTTKIDSRSVKGLIKEMIDNKVIINDGAIKLESFYEDLCSASECELGHNH